MAVETQRFRRYGGPVTIDELIKDCRSLEEEVNRLSTQNKSLEERIKALEDPKGT